MSLITRMRRQNAVYWALDSIDQFGKKTFSSPVQIKVRWDDVTEEFLDSEGVRQVSKAVVYVGEDIEEGSVLMLGELSDITDAVNIKENEGAWEVRMFAKTPNLRATEFLRRAYL